MTGQPRHHSLLEAVLNVVIGFLIALAGQLIVYPVLNIPVSLNQNILIGGIFTLISMVRSYCLRRLFNWWHVNGLRF